MTTRPAIGGDPLIGCLFAGRYHVEGLIATGGMGKVYRARQATPDRLVALKVVRPDLAVGASAGERFRREMSATALIEHPHTVRVYDFGQAEGGELYFAMELLDGETLRQTVARDGALSPARAIAIGRQTAKALGAAHDKGIVHRDVKPDNLMLTSPYGERDFVKVLDFGLARFAEGDGERQALTATGLLLGTPDYMAPEQAEERAIDGRTDLYALGCVLYHAVTGAPPFSATTPLRVLYKHLHEPPRPPSELRPDLPAGLEALILRLLAKDPAGRPSSAHEVIAELDALTRSLGGAPPVETTPFERPRLRPAVHAPTEVTATPPAFLAEDAPPPRRWTPGMTVASAAVVLLALGVGIVAGLAGREGAGGAGAAGAPAGPGAPGGVEAPAAETGAPAGPVAGEGRAAPAAGSYEASGGSGEAPADHAAASAGSGQAPADHAAALGGSGEAPADHAAALGGSGEAPAEQATALGGSGEAPADQAAALGGSGGAPADQAAALGGSGGAPADHAAAPAGSALHPADGAQGASGPAAAAAAPGQPGAGSKRAGSDAPPEAAAPVARASSDAGYAGAGAASRSDSRAKPTAPARKRPRNEPPPDPPASGALVPW